MTRNKPKELLREGAEDFKEKSRKMKQYYDNLNRLADLLERYDSIAASSLERDKTVVNGIAGTVTIWNIEADETMLREMKSELWETNLSWDHEKELYKLEMHFEFEL